MTDDVYAPGSGELLADDEPAAVIVRALRQTWPWAAFLGVLLLLSNVLMFAAGIGMLALGSMIPMLPPEADPMGIGRWLGLVYLAFGVLFVPMTFLLLRFAVAALRVSDSDGLASAARAVRTQRDFWIGYAVMTLILMLAYCGGIVAVVAGTMAALS